MTEYYWLYHELKIPGKWYLADILGPDGKEVLPITFTQGLSVDPVPKLTIVPNVVGNPVDFTFQTFQVPVVSTAFADIVESFDADSIQRIPVTIAPAQTGFEILNIVKLVDCLDYEKSELTRFGELHPELYPEDMRGKISAFIKLRIIPERAEGHHIFRLGEYEGVIIVSKALKRALENEGFTGMKFKPASV